MNVLDLILLLMLAWFAARGFRQGALSQVAGLGGAGLGLVLGGIVAPRVASMIVDTPGPELALVTLGALLICIIIGQGIGMAIGFRLRAVAAGVGAAPVDRTAGVAVGVAALIVVVWLLAEALAQGPIPTVAQQVRESTVVSTIDSALPPPPDLFGRLGSYLDQQGFPQVFSGLGGATAPPVDPPSEGAVAAAVEAGQASTVQVQATGCGGISTGTGFVVQSGFVVTNAHVVAGGDGLTVRDGAGTHEAVAVHYDSDIDLAVLSSPAAAAPAIGWVGEPAQRGTQGATLGFPGGQRELAVKPATVRERHGAVGRDIYGRGLVEREVLTLDADVQRGDSGGPFVTSDGLVGGVVFAAAPADPGTGYALTAESVRPDVDAAVARNQAVGTGSCRF